MNGITLFKKLGCNIERPVTIPVTTDSDHEEFSKIASEAPIASEVTQSAVKKVLSKHKNPIACPESGKLMKNERGVKQNIAKMHK
ncbi:hypothetical protein BpHYR1_042742 [Brachionus plicatilis]|uniref:Uncharacterized protein n=1 Tax=Brachionus plicatilis TaxID=10195 RepID=A0A3M7SAK6_BRAPC|nr:hypothetical protein BpHYR1_042742 [Brachionus plicatilis]